MHEGLRGHQADLLAGSVARETRARTVPRRSWREEKAAVRRWFESLPDWKRAEIAELVRDVEAVDSRLADAVDLLVSLNAHRVRLKENTRGLAVPDPPDPKHPNLKHQLARRREGISKSDLAAIMARRANAVKAGEYRFDWLVPCTLWNRQNAHKRAAELPPEPEQ